MDLDDVCEEIRAALDDVPDLTVPELGVTRVHGPTAFVGYPEEIKYDQTYGRGCDEFSDLMVAVVVPDGADARSVRKTLARYADGAGPHSVKARIEGYAYDACDSVHVARCRFETGKAAGAPVIVAEFYCRVIGEGA